MVPRVLGTPGLWPSHSCSRVRALGGRLAEAADSRSPPLRHGNWGAIWKAPLYSKGPPASPQPNPQPSQAFRTTHPGCICRVGGPLLARASPVPPSSPRSRHGTSNAGRGCQQLGPQACGCGTSPLLSLAWPPLPGPFLS